MLNAQRLRVTLSVIVLMSAGLCIGGVWLTVRRSTPKPASSGLIMPVVRQDVPSRLAIWPWPRAIKETPPGQVTHWQDASSPDGTRLDLFDYDVGRNPNLRLEIFDQDQDAVLPFANAAPFWEHGVGQITRQLNTTFAPYKQGRVLAAWNGLFF